VSELPTSIEVHSTRLFPKMLGAEAYVPTGIAARCDWVVMSDDEEPHTSLLRRVDTRSPRHVFLSLRSPFAAIKFFHDQVLAQIEAPFVLVSGSEDITIPNQLDLRWRRFHAPESRKIEAILQDPRVLHWFAENLDARSHPKFSPMPLGLVFHDPQASHRIPVPQVPPQAARPLRALCAHRVREDWQWDVRREVTELCRQHFSEFCTIPDGEVPLDEFERLMHQHAFVICAEGGGLDPSPKAWHALLHGAIPIVRSTALDQAYAGLPVVFIQGWDASTLSLEQLRDWQRQHAPAQDEPAKRERVLQLLGIESWWSKICSLAPPAGAG
jgi:hypothetical protein